MFIRLYRGVKVMYCKECGSLVKYQGRRIPECCNMCGAKFKIIPNFGMAICGIITMVLMVPIAFFLKNIIPNEKFVYVIGLVLLIVIFNITESILLKSGIIQYTNLKI